MKDKVVMVGWGNMGFEMMRGWIERGIMKDGEVNVVEKDEEMREREELENVNVYEDEEEMKEDIKKRMVMVEVKKKMMENVMKEYKRLEKD